MQQFFKRNSALIQLSGANFLVLAIPTLLLPVFSRLYSEGDFAQFGIYTATISLLLPFFSLHFQQAIPVPQEKNRINALSQLSLILGGITVSVVTILWYALPTFRALFDPQDSLLNYKILIPLGLGLSGFIQILQHWILQGGHFKAFAKSKSALAISQSLYRYFMGVTQWIGGGLIWSFALAQFTQIIVFGRRFRVGPFVGFQALKEVAANYSGFLKFGLPASILFAVTNSLPLTLMAHFYPETVVGQFSMSLRIGSIPIFLLATAFGQVYFADCKKSPENLARETEAFIIKTFKFITPFICLGLFILERVGAWVIGEVWGLALSMTVLLLPSLWLSFVVLPLTHLFELKNRQGLGLIYAVLAILLRLTPLCMGLYFGASATEVVLYLSVGTFLSNVLGLYLATILSGISWSFLCKKLWIYWAVGFLCICFYFLFYS